MSKEEDKRIDIIQTLFERLLGSLTEVCRELIEIKIIEKRSLLSLLKLNEAMNIMNYISGANPKISKEQIEKEFNLEEEYVKELRERLSKVSLEDLRDKDKKVK